MLLSHRAAAYTLAGTALALSIGLSTGCGGGGVNNRSTTNASAKAGKTRDAGADPDPHFVSDPDSVPNQYVVSFVDDGAQPASANTAAKPGTAQSNATAQPIAGDPVTIATDISSQYGAQLTDTFTSVGSFVATMTEAQARQMSHDSRVQCVLSDSYAVSSTTQPVPFDYVLDRIDQRSSNLDGNYTYQNTGAGVHAYIMDTGIYVQHPELEGRASLDYCPIAGHTPDEDSASGNTHGTDIAGIIGGKTYGIAKGVRLHSVKVGHGDTGSDQVHHSYVSDVTKGFDWIVKNAQRPAVVNCSFGGKHVGSSFFGIFEGTTPQEKALVRAVKAGITVVCSAGNDNQDCKDIVPAYQNEAITVGATDRYGARAYFSNYGSHITLFAPGDAVPSISYSGQGAGRTPITEPFYGTSAAAPVVTGVVALYLQSHPSASPADVKNWLIANATSNAVIPTNTVPAGTANRLLFTNL